MLSDGMRARRRTARRGCAGTVRLLLGIAVCAGLLCSAGPVQAVLLERVSVSDIGEPAAVDEFCLSANGRVVAFRSDSEYLTGERLIGGRQVYAHDRDTYHTELISVSSSGEAGNNQSYNISMSGDGRFVVFTSEAGNLVPGGIDNVPQVYIRDRLVGTTEQVSVSSSGELANTQSNYGHISTDGRFIIFGSGADNLVAGTHPGLGRRVPERSGPGDDGTREP